MSTKTRQRSTKSKTWFGVHVHHEVVPCCCVFLMMHDHLNKVAYSPRGTCTAIVWLWSYCDACPPKRGNGVNGVRHGLECMFTTRCLSCYCVFLMMHDHLNEVACSPRGTCTAIVWLWGYCDACPPKRSKRSKTWFGAHVHHEVPALLLCFSNDG